MMEKCEDCYIKVEPAGGCCGSALLTTESGNYAEYNSYQFTFCPDCGHKIDWEKINDNRV